MHNTNEWGRVIKYLEWDFPGMEFVISEKDNWHKIIIPYRGMKHIFYTTRRYNKCLEVEEIVVTNKDKSKTIVVTGGAIAVGTAISSILGKW